MDGKSESVAARCETCCVVGPMSYFDPDDDDAIESADASAISAWNRRAKSEPAESADTAFDEAACRAQCDICNGSVATDDWPCANAIADRRRSTPGFAQRTIVDGGEVVYTDRDGVVRRVD